jgi:hypothetical protein
MHFEHSLRHGKPAFDAGLADCKLFRSVRLLSLVIFMACLVFTLECCTSFRHHNLDANGAVALLVS